MMEWGPNSHLVCLWRIQVRLTHSLSANNNNPSKAPAKDKAQTFNFFFGVDRNNSTENPDISDNPDRKKLISFSNMDVNQSVILFCLCVHRF
jgi:hypothetical protein